MLLLVGSIILLATPNFCQSQDGIITEAEKPTPIPILNHAEVMGDGGNFNYSYETGNGIRYEQEGFTKLIPGIPNRAGDEDGEDQVVQVVRGSYSYVAPDGTQINLRYVADENGFQPEGDHLPTPPPIPEGIKRLLEMLHKNNEPQTNEPTQQVENTLNNQ